MRLIDADELPKYDGYALSANEIAVAVENAPTIEAEPIRHGHWINDQGLWRCSNCNTLETGFWASVVPIERMWKFCPCCGAKMDEVEE